MSFSKDTCRHVHIERVGTIDETTGAVCVECGLEFVVAPPDSAAPGGLAGAVLDGSYDNGMGV